MTWPTAGELTGRLAELLAGIGAGAWCGLTADDVQALEDETVHRGPTVGAQLPGAWRAPDGLDEGPFPEPTKVEPLPAADRLFDLMSR